MNPRGGDQGFEEGFQTFALLKTNAMIGCFKPMKKLSTTTELKDSTCLYQDCIQLGIYVAY